MMAHHLRKQDSGEYFIHNIDNYIKFRIKAKPTTLLRLCLLFSAFFFSFAFVFFVFLFSSSSSSSSSLLCNNNDDDHEYRQQHQPSPCSPANINNLCCDRTSPRTDVCFLRGDIRTGAAFNSIFLIQNTTISKEERIRPYTRKWEKHTMSTIDELRLRPTTLTNITTSPCDVTHHVPAVVFSTGGYTGNVYHEFNDGILPLYITSHRFDRRVVFVILEYHDWWITKYADILSQLSDYPPVDFARDGRTHCFPEAIAGLDIHDELSIDPKRMTDNRTILDFRAILDQTYRLRIVWISKEEKITKQDPQKPKLVVISRNRSRGIENQDELTRLAKDVGFQVEVLQPTKTSELAKIYRSLNSSDVMMGVHGAAMTHFLFMRPGSVFIQIVPLGTDWAAEAYYGSPAAKMGIKYVKYKVIPRESSLYREYAKDDPVLRDPDSVNAKGWEVTKRVYLDGQNVRLDLGRVRKRLVKALEYVEGVRKRRKSFKEQRR